MKNKKGFSLLELILCLLIFSMILYLYVVNSYNSKKYSKLEAVTYNIKNIIERVRTKAILFKNKHRIYFYNSSLIVKRYIKSKWRKHRHYTFDNYQLYCNNSPIFYPKGTVSNLFSLYIKKDELMKKITMNITGRLKIYD